MTTPWRTISLLAATAAVGCGGGGDVPLKLKLSKVKRDTIPVSVKSAPNQAIRSGQKTITTNGKGRAKLKLKVDTSGELPYGLKSGVIDVSAVDTSVFGKVRGEVMGKRSLAHESLRLDFNPKRLRDAPKSPKESWLRFVGWGPGEKYIASECLSITGEVGEGVVNVKGGPFFGPPGARVTIGNDAFTIKKTGIGIWKPPRDAKFTLFASGDIKATLPVAVSAKGKEPWASSIQIRLRSGCEKAAAEVVAEAVKDKKPLPGATGERRPFAVIARAEGKLLKEDPTYRSGGASLGSAKYVAVEEDTERHPSTSCSKAVYYNATHDQIIQVSKTPIDTRVTLYALPGYEKVDSADFPAPDSGCDSEVRVRDYDITRWVGDIIKAREPKPEPKKRGRRRRR